MSGFIAKHNGNLLHSTEDLVKKKAKQCLNLKMTWGLRPKQGTEPNGD